VLEVWLRLKSDGVWFGGRCRAHAWARRW